MTILKNHYFLLVLSLILVFGGGLLASLIQTNGGNVVVKDIRFTTAKGDMMSALLYVPSTATPENPAPAALAVHGYINTRETQSPYSIELARRGYVVLAIDQRGHGYSDPPAFAERFGGPDGLTYLRSLNMVDKNQIVLSGHSMGGWTVLSAAAALPEGYAAVVVSGSSTGVFGVPAGDAKFPRNFAVVYGKYDEFSATMWGSPTGAGVVDTEKMKKAFNTDTTVEIGKLYGSLADGSARKLYQPAQTHPANHITHSGIAAVVDWVQTTTNAPKPISPDDQVWQWKEFGTLISLIGGVMFLFGFAKVVIAVPFFAHLREQPAPAVGIHNAGWWLAAAIFVAIPALTYFYFQGLAGGLGSNRWLSQNLTTGFMVWAVGNALISVVLFLLWHFFLGGKRGGGNAHSYGLTWSNGTLKKLGLTALMAIVVVAGLYLVLAVNVGLFTADFRIWVVALKLMNTLQFCIFLGYFIPFTVFFVLLGLPLHGQLRGNDNTRFAVVMLRNAVLMGLGIAVLLLYQYAPLFAGNTLAIPAQALLTIVALQFVVLLPIAGLISTYCFHLTGHVYLGGFVNGLFLTWLIVAGQATHFGFT